MLPYKLIKRIRINFNRIFILYSDGTKQFIDDSVLNLERIRKELNQAHFVRNEQNKEQEEYTSPFYR